MMTRDLIDRAEALARWIHAGQVRKGTDTPYIEHPLEVARFVETYGGTEAEVAAALLHDVIEDGDGKVTVEELEAKFGADVAGIVAACTDTDPEREAGDPKEPWIVRKVRALEHLAGAGPSTAMVKAADKLHNVLCCVEDQRAVGHELWLKFLKQSDEPWEVRRDKVLANLRAVHAGLGSLGHERTTAIVERLGVELKTLEEEGAANAEDGNEGRPDCPLCCSPLPELAWAWPLEAGAQLVLDSHEGVAVMRCPACARFHVDVQVDVMCFGPEGDAWYRDRFLVSDDVAESLRAHEGEVSAEMLARLSTNSPLLQDTNGRLHWSTGPTMVWPGWRGKAC